MRTDLDDFEVEPLFTAHLEHPFDPLGNPVHCEVPPVPRSWAPDPTLFGINLRNVVVFRDLPPPPPYIPPDWPERGVSGW